MYLDPNIRVLPQSHRMLFSRPMPAVLVWTRQVLTTVVNIFVEDRNDHSFVYNCVSPVFSDTSLLVRQTKQLAKNSVEISTDTSW